MSSDFSCSQIKQDINNIQKYLTCAKISFEKQFHSEKMEETSLKDFILHKTIGMGAFGRVLLVNHKSDDSKFLAMKVLNKEQIMRKNNIRYVLNEKKFLYSIRHPFIIHMEYYANDSCNLYYIMPFAVGGDLFNLLTNKGLLDEFNARFYSGQLVLAIEYLHTMDIIYRDLKPENILIIEDGFIKLTDLGLSKRTSKNTTTMCGTAHYLAPEIIASIDYGKPIDWWALGIVIFELVTGNVPFVAEERQQLYSNILKGNYQIPNTFSPELSDLIENLLQIDFTKRYGNLKNGINDIKEHGWFNTVDWILMLNKKVKAPFIPSYNGPSDTRNFDNYTDEETINIEKKCDYNHDQIFFDEF